LGGRHCGVPWLGIGPGLQVLRDIQGRLLLSASSIADSSTDRASSACGTASSGVDPAKASTLARTAALHWSAWALFIAQRIGVRPPTCHRRSMSPRLRADVVGAHVLVRCSASEPRSCCSSHLRLHGSIQLGPQQATRLLRRRPSAGCGQVPPSGRGNRQ
jgi:hypothetical protein